MNNPKTHKNNSSKDVQKRSSGKFANKSNGINLNQQNNIKDKPGKKFPSKVEKKNLGLEKISDNNIRKSLKNPNVHMNHMELNFQINQRQQIKPHNPFNIKSSINNNQMNPTTFQSKNKYQFANQNQLFPNQNQNEKPNKVVNQNQLFPNQNQNEKQNKVVNKNQFSNPNHIANQNHNKNQNQGGKPNQISNQNQCGKHIQDTKPIIMRKGVQNIGKELFNKDNNTKRKNNNVFNMNINSGENKIDSKIDNQPILRGKPSQKKLVNIPIDHIQLLSYKEKTFYINSILYCLANNDKIINYLHDNLENNKFGDSQRLAIYLFYRVIYHLIYSTSAYSLKYFYENIISHNPIFNGDYSKKLVGFLLFLLEQFHEEDKKLRNIHPNIELNEEIYTNINKFQNYLKFSEDSFVLNNYGWINEKTIKCLVCSKETVTYSCYFTYDLNISSAISKYIIELASGNNENVQNLTIRKCLDYNTNSEKIYNVYCKFCDKKTNLERQNLIHSINDNIIILLSGIEHGNIINLIRENNINIKVDKYLEINKNLYSINSVIYYNIKKKEYFNYCYKINIWVNYSNNGIKKEVNEDFLNKDDFNIVPVVIFYSLNK